MRRYVLPLGLIALLLTGCASDSNSAKPSPTSTPSPTTIPASVAADRTKIEAALLKTDDLPEWKLDTTASGSTAVQAANNALASCLGLSDSTVALSAQAQNRFVNNGHVIASNVRAHKTASTAKADLAALKSSKAPVCAAPQVNVLVKNSLDAINANPITEIGRIPDVVLRDDEFGLRAMSTVQMASGAMKITTDFLGVTVDRYCATLSMTYIGKPPPRDLETSLFSKSRLRIS